MAHDYKNNLIYSPNFLLEVAKGNVDGYTYVHKYGANADVDTAVEDVWSYGGTYTYPAAAAANYISSSNAGDTQNYDVYGLDANWEPQKVTVTAAGQTKTRIGTTETFIRVFRIVNQGSTTNAGTVYVYEDDTVVAGVPQTASKVKAIVDASAGQTLMTHYTIPVNCTGFLLSGSATMGRAITSIVEIKFLIRESGKSFLLKEIVDISDTTGILTVKYPIPLPVPQKSDLKVTALPSANNTKVRAFYDLLIVDNDKL